MFEIFFFINPIGINCYESEQSIINAINNSKQNVDYHFIPMANMTTIRNDLRARNLPTTDLGLFNQVSINTFSAIKDYHGVKLLKGNKLARKFLLNLQSSINDGHKPYSYSLTKSILEDLNISSECFSKTRETNYTHSSMQKDLQLAEQFNVKTTPTTFIYNYCSNNSDYVIEGKVQESDIQAILKNEASKVCSNNTNFLHLL